MSATTDEVLRVLGGATKPMTCAQIIDAGSFDNAPLVGVALHDMFIKQNDRLINRVKPEDGGRYQYELSEVGRKLGRTGVARTVHLLDDDKRPPKAIGPVTDVREVVRTVTPAAKLEPDPAKREPAAAKGRPEPAPANDGAYAAVLFDLRRKREGHAAEIAKIDAAMLTLEALA